MHGIVNSLFEPIIFIGLVLGERVCKKQAVIDTGFNGYLCVPEIIASNWIFFGYEDYEIATGEIVRQKVYLGKIIWQRKIQDVYSVTSKSNDILIGTKLLRKNTLKIDFPKRMVLIK